MEIEAKAGDGPVTLTQADFTYVVVGEGEGDDGKEIEFRCTLDLSAEALLQKVCISCHDYFLFFFLSFVFKKKYCLSLLSKKFL